MLLKILCIDLKTSFDSISRKNRGQALKNSEISGKLRIKLRGSYNLCVCKVRTMNDYDNWFEINEAVIH